jgi:hypothetical protein
MEMNREPILYSRLLIFVVLVPLLLVDLFVGLPDGGFVGGSAVVFLTAAVVHFRGDEPKAGAGWLVFGAALALFAAVDPTANPLYLIGFGLLLTSGVALLASQRLAGDG